MFKPKTLKLRNKIILIITITFIVIGALTVFLIYPNIQNPLLERQLAQSETLLKKATEKISSSYNQNNYYIDKIINAKTSHETRLLVIRILNKNSAFIVADNLDDKNIEGKNIISNKNILGDKLTDLIIDSDFKNIKSNILNINDNYFVVSYEKFSSPDIYKSKMAVLTIKNINFIYESITIIFFKLISISVMYSIFVILLIILLIDYILTPLNQLQDGISEIKKGNLGYNVNILSKDEFEQLGNLFNKMSNQLLQDDIQKKDFIASVSHELKTPISSIKTISQLLMTTTKEQENLDFLTDINNSIDRMNNLINDLLVLAELQEINRLNLTEVSTDVFIKTSLSTLKLFAEKKNVKLSLDIQNFKIKLDVLKFERVIINLVDNAIKYSNENSTVSISCYKKNASFILSVSDNGIGIPKDSVDKIFDKFYRVDKARSRKTGGTGLGLSIVKEIVDFHSGTINVTSNEGVGTTFVITLPIE